MWPRSLPELTRGMPADAAVRTTSFLRTRGLEWARRADTGVCEVARDTARRLGLPESTQQALYHVYESWVGGWVPHGLKGDDIAVASRVARAAMEAAFFSQLGGADAAVAALRKRAGGLLDPAVVAAFAADPHGILAEVDQGDPHELMLAVEPEPVLERKASELAEVAAAFGDLADVKMPFLHGHSRRVAELASGGARRLGLDAAEVRRIEVAGLLHDVGRVGVSNAVWEKRGPLTRMEWEQVRMHGYYSERILATSPSLAPLAPLVGMHHERLDGSGYHRCCTAAGIPMARPAGGRRGRVRGDAAASPAPPGAVGGAGRRRTDRRYRGGPVRPRRGGRRAGRGGAPRPASPAVAARGAERPRGGGPRR